MMLALALILKTLTGASVDPFADAQRAVALVFIQPDCPVSNRYAPELNRLYDAYESRGIKMYLVYPGVGNDEASIHEHHRSFALRVPALRDPDYRLTSLAGATITPEAVVFTPDERLVYRGRIDDRALRTGTWRAVAVARDLAGVLDRLARGEHMEAFTTQAVGCYIRPLS